MIIRALLVLLALTAGFAGVQTMRLSWAMQEAAESNRKAAEEVIRRDRLNSELAEARRQLSARRAERSRDVIRHIETGEFSNADDLLDPNLADELERLRGEPAFR